MKIKIKKEKKGFLILGIICILAGLSLGVPFFYHLFTTDTIIIQLPTVAVEQAPKSTDISYLSDRAFLMIIPALIVFAIVHIFLLKNIAVRLNIKPWS